VVDAARVSGTLAGSGELEGLRFYGVSEATALDLALATRLVFDKLLKWRAMAEEERRTQTRVAVLHNREWVWEAEDSAS
jgi:hypothetical protein